MKSKICLAIKLSCIITCLLLTSMLTYAQSGTFNKETLESFCRDKSIWSAFGIEEVDCVKAAKDCTKEDRFKNLDPKLLSESYYECVFTKLDISI